MKRSVCHLAYGLAFVLAGACAAIGPNLTVAYSELAVLGGKEPEALTTARGEEEQAHKALKQLRAELIAVEREIRIAEHAVRREEADLAIARLRVEAVQETHEADAMVPANARRVQAEQALTVAEAELRYREAARVLCKAQIDEAEAGVEVALANVEQLKLAAVLGTQPKTTPEQDERRAAFDVQVAKARTALAEESAQVAKAKPATQTANEQWQALLKSPDTPPATEGAARTP